MIRTEHEGDFCVITMAGPRRNALSVAMMQALIAALRECQGKVVILAAEGPAFSAGHDLNELVGCTSERAKEIFAVCTELMETVQWIPQPVIAQVQGVATAAGCQLVASCDLAVASEEAWFATPGVRIGLFCSTPMVALTRAIGRKRAMEMLLTARQVSAREAAEWGLINRAVPQGELAASVRALGRSIAEGSDHTVAIGKRAFYEQVDMTQPAAYRYTRGVMEDNALASEAQDRMRAFLEKRTVR
jgi:enoyl-CoA hydratase/carnithine racemase